MKIQILYLSNPAYANIWNCLTAETLLGDLKAYLNNMLDYRIIILEDICEIQSTIKKIQYFNPDILGISVQIDTLNIFEHFISNYINIHDDINPLLVLGNTIPQNNIDYFINHYTMKKINYVIGLGQGEFILRQLADVVLSKKTLQDVKNIIYWNSDKQIATEHPFLKTELAELTNAPTYDTIKNDQVNMLQTSRGCYFNCSYCSQGPGKSWERFPLNKIYENINNLISLGITKFEFIDEDFFGGRSRKNLYLTNQIIDFLSEENKKNSVSYRIFTNPSVLYSEKESENTCSNSEMQKLLLKMKKTGLIRIYIGVESRSLTQRQRYNRKETLLEIEQSLIILRKYNLEIDVGFIMFDPLLTINEISENINFFRKNNLIDAYAWPIGSISLIKNSPYSKLLINNNHIITTYNVNMNAYEYRFNDKTIQMIYTILHTIASCTSKIFYKIKFNIKKYFSDDEKVQLSKILSKQNSLIYLNLLDELIKNQQIEKTVLESFKKVEELMLIVNENINLLNIDIHDFDRALDNLINLKLYLCEPIKSLNRLYQKCSKKKE